MAERAPYTESDACPAMDAMWIISEEDWSYEWMNINQLEEYVVQSV